MLKPNLALLARQKKPKSDQKYRIRLLLRAENNALSAFPSFRMRLACDVTDRSRACVQLEYRLFNDTAGWLPSKTKDA